MTRIIGISRLFSLFLAGGIALTVAYRLNAQAPSQPGEPAAPAAGPARGLAPKLKVTEFPKTSRTFEVVLSKGDEVASGLAEFAEKYHIKSAYFTGVGALDSASLRWSDPTQSDAKRRYKGTQINEEAEVVAFNGNIMTVNGKTTVHAHAVVALSDGSTRGGHFVEGRVSITMQIFVIDSDSGDSVK